MSRNKEKFDEPEDIADLLPFMEEGLEEFEEVRFTACAFSCAIC
jgi:hypothetical protein